MTQAGVLIIEDEAGLREGLASAVSTLGLRPLPAAGLVEARLLLSEEQPDCILLDIRLKDGDGLAFLKELRAGPNREIPVIVATAYGDSERTISAMRDGAFDYLTKPFNLPGLLATVERATKQRALSRHFTPAPASSSAAGGLVGASAAMLAIWKLIGRAAASSSPVLITGETGVGKELVARAIHQYSERAGEPFVAVNLAAIPTALLESELFGHEKGSFTGAVARRTGRFETAGQGTLFLDELGDLGHALQSQLLRVLQDSSFERLGGNEPVINRARVLTATSKPVHPNEPGCVLREDLYYRLAVLEIHIPPLRQRRSDIPLLVAHALAATPARAVSEEAMQCLVNYAWIGNVRELIHVIQRAAVLCGGEVIDVHNLPESIRTQSAAPDSESSRIIPLRLAVAEVERRMLLRALAQSGGNRSEAARKLGIARAQLYVKLEEHGITLKTEPGPTR